MDINRQRIALALLDGATKEEKPWGYILSHEGCLMAIEEGYEPPLSGLPDYLNDLNAMHRVIGRLDDEDYCTYSALLFDVVKCSDADLIMNTRRKLREATATQKAEAVLRALGKWEGGES